jgi:hypothetical protein
MNKPCLLIFTALSISLWGSGCASPRGQAFSVDDPSAVLARAWQFIDSGCAREEGSFKRDDLRLSAIEYSSDGTSVEASFYVVSTFKTDADGRFTCKLLDIEMSKDGKFISASTANRTEGASPAIGF